MQKIYEEINILKGIGILLVILGHLHEPDAGHSSWRWFREIIYTFHMPLFFMISGYLYALTTSQKNRKYLTFLKKSTQRNIIPFLSFSCITIVYKMAIQHFLGPSYLQYPVNLDNIISHLVNPQGGFATYLWFLYTLFIIHISYPLLKKYAKHDAIMLLIFVLLNIATLPHFFCLNLFIRHMPFYIVGNLLFHLKPLKRGSDQITIIMFFLVGLYGVTYFFGNNLFFSYIILGVTAVCSLWIFSRKLLSVRIGKVFSYMGNLSIDIYLWHTLFIGVSKFIVQRSGITEFWSFTLCSFLITCAACFTTAAALDRMAPIKYCLYGR